MFQQTDDVGRHDERLTTNVEVDGRHRARAELCGAAEQSLGAGLRRQVKDDDGSVLAGADQLILQTSDRRVSLMSWLVEPASCVNWVSTRGRMKGTGTQRRFKQLQISTDASADDDLRKRQRIPQRPSVETRERERERESF